MKPGDVIQIQRCENGWVVSPDPAATKFELRVQFVAESEASLHDVIANIINPPSPNPPRDI